MIQRTSRDNARTPMQWSSAENAGFTSGKPWLKINRNFAEVNVAAENAKEDGVLSFWKRMTALRKSDSVLVNGDFSPIYEGSRVYAFARSYNGRRLISVCNMSGRAAKLPRALRGYVKLIISSYKDSHNDRLMPFEFRLYESETEK